MQLVGQTDCGLSDVSCCGGEPVTLSSDGEVEVWLGSQRRLVTEGVSSMVSLPDGRLVVGRSDGYLEFWDVATAGWTERVRGRVPGPIRCLASDATGRFLAASTGDNDLTVWRDGRRRWTSRAVHITIHSVAIGRDGRVYTGGERDRSILLSDLEIGNEICRLENPGKEVHALVV